ncbi:MAG: sugar phosphate isomerase/epimerase family protein [Candidatus Acidiferrales bacterium]
MTKFALNGATTQPLDQASEIRLAGAAGFDLIEFRAPKLEAFLRSGTLAELKALLDAARLAPLSINAIEQVNTRPAGGAAALEEECEQLARWAAVLGCPFLVAVPGFLREPQPREETVARTVDTLAPLAERAEAHGVRLGFEFLGFVNCTVNRLATAREIVRRLASPHVGLVIDTFHFYLGGEPVELLRELEPGELLVFHVNDAEPQPRATLADHHRLLPGRGVIPLREMWSALQERKVIDHASLELFRPEYWERLAEPFLREALDSLRETFH